MKIIEENDRRFRVKKKINDFVNSSLKEQKGYARSKAIILTHLGNGDNITCNGLVRYYSTKYDNITVFCKKQNLHNLEEFYKDDKTISFYTVENNWKYSKQEGLAVGWHENGLKAGESDWKDGKKISSKYWNNKGEPVDTYEEAQK